MPDSTAPLYHAASDSNSHINRLYGSLAQGLQGAAGEIAHGTAQQNQLGVAGEEARNPQSATQLLPSWFEGGLQQEAPGGTNPVQLNQYGQVTNPDIQKLNDYGQYQLIKANNETAGKVILAGLMSVWGAAGGAVLAPALSGAAASAGAGAASSAVGNVGAGLAEGAASAALTGQNVGKGALLGGIGAGIASSASSLTNGLGQTISADTGLPATASNTLAGGLVRTGAGALTGAVSGQLSGQGAGTGALSGAESGAIHSGEGIVQGSILSGLGSAAGGLFGSNSNSSSSDSSNSSPYSPAFQAANSSSTGNNNMPDFGGDYTTNDPSLYDATNTQYDPGNLPTQTDNTGLFDPNAQGPSGGYNLNVQGGGSTDPLSGGYGNGSSSGGSSGGLLSALAGLFSHGGGGLASGGNSGGIASLLSQLLGTGASAAGGVLNHNAAVGAANTYAGQTQFNPYSITSNAGTTGFNGTNATSSLSAGQQQMSNNLNAIGNQSAQSLQAGPDAASQGFFNQLQAQDRDSNNKAFQSNLDSQFANGVLGSTAGQYQSQAALGAINQKTLQDQVLANQFGQNQQQQQLGQLTASLNGNNAINANQLSQLQLAGNLGGQAGNVNLQAFKPGVAANSNTPLGGVLSSLGAQATNQYGIPQQPTYANGG